MQSHFQPFENMLNFLIRIVNVR